MTPKLTGQAPPDYAGDVSPRATWAAMQRDADARLVDVRTAAEWTFVGMPDLTGLNRPLVAVEWQVFPAMGRNEEFMASVVAQLAQSGATVSGAIYFLCRSGGRSAGAARLATANGVARAYNIAGGFEGDLDPQGHRGNINGWKADGLAWVQK